LTCCRKPTCPRFFPAGTSLADLIDTDQVATGTHAFYAVALNSESETLGEGGYSAGPGACEDDADCDGVTDTQDNCPNLANADQADFDGDGIGDACELDEEEDRLTFESGCRDIARTMGLGGSVLEDAVCGVVLASLDGVVNGLCNVFSFIPGAEAFCPVYADGPGNGSAVIIGEQIIVQDADARAVIERNPFRLKFVDPVTGETVLQQVPQGLPAPQPIGNADPEPGGFDFLPEHAVYEPLSFEVGGEADVQHPVFLFTGNMLAGAYAGVVHHATQVRAARATADGKGVLMTVATTDPTRDLTVRIELDKGSAIRVRANPSNRAGVMAMGDSFVSTANEAFHGFGGRHNTINQRGQAFYGWVEEEGINANFLKPVIDQLDAAGRDRYIFPNGPHQAYYVQNLFMSSNPYGFLLNQTELSRWRMAADREDAWQVRSRSSSIDYSVAIGTPQKVAGTLGRINGRHRLPERWSMGPALKRNVQQGSESVASYTAKVRQDLQDIKFHMQNTGLRVEGYSFEGWDSMDPAVVADINRQFNEIGVKTIGYVRAYANNDGVFDPQGFFEEAVLGGYCVQLAPGVPFPGVAAGAACLIDFTNPAAVEWFRTRKLKKMLDLGFDGFMQDFGEQVLEPMRFHDGSTGVEMHNQYPVLYHRLTREFVDQYQADCPRLTQGTYTIPSNNQSITPLPLPCGKFFMYTRTGFSGREGSVAYEDSNFPGDESTDWTPSTGIPSLTPDMLNRVIGGAFGFNTDIGGYFDQFAVDVLDDDLFGRWSQWAALTPFFRLHNSSGSGTRMPWVFTNGGYDAWKTAANLHVEARPLIRRLWQYGIEQGLPPTRPMWMAYPDDAQARVQEQQWMLGDNILVAPVVEKATTSKQVYFPAGTWVRAVYDGSRWVASSDPSQRITGPQQLTVPAPADQLPFYFRVADANGTATGAQRAG
jgi:sulfoquinovosidase